MKTRNELINDRLNARTAGQRFKAAKALAACEKRSYAMARRHANAGNTSVRKNRS